MFKGASFLPDCLPSAETYDCYCHCTQCALGLGRIPCSFPRLWKSQADDTSSFPAVFLQHIYKPVESDPDRIRDFIPSNHHLLYSNAEIHHQGCRFWCSERMMDKPPLPCRDDESVFLIPGFFMLHPYQELP